MAICKEIVIQQQHLELRPHPEDRANTHDKLDALYEEKKDRCKCGRIAEYK